MHTVTTSLNLPPTNRFTCCVAPLHTLKLVPFYPRYFPFLFESEATSSELG